MQSNICPICKQERPRHIKNRKICRECYNISQKEKNLASGRTKRTNDVPSNDLAGKRVGSLTVTAEHFIKNHIRHWVCLCDCGNQTIVRHGNLTHNVVKSCGCLKHRLGSKSPHWTGHEEISGRVWAKIKKGADSRKIPFSITVEYAWKLFIEQGRRCVLTGEVLSFDKSNRTASLDRIDSSKGYVEGNLQWVHTEINWLKNEWPQDKFISLCKKVADFHKVY